MSDLAADRAAGLLAAGRPALVVVDVQRDFADPELLAGWGVDESGLAAVASAVARCGELVFAARASGVPVVWVELAYDPSRPWRASAWLRSGSLDTETSDFPCVAGSPGAAWWRLEPLPDETRVRKRFYSGFAGTDLAEQLERLEVGWITVAGLTTECCILATVTDAAQHDLPVVLAEDATAAYSPELHRASVESMALNSADVRSVHDVATLWQGAAA
ncbi:cysteine hydrolase family protein [Herbiconiux sp. P15]|uniref:cysteine hydrolase family protein n=1 Tax=Herbiconiux liukaitaii TaxID=3342799 RepID=UPI0035BA7B34